jgi:hypothetical protein
MEIAKVESFQEGLGHIGSDGSRMQLKFYEPLPLAKIQGIF